jgi:hypothetical protein
MLVIAHGLMKTYAFIKASLSQVGGDPALIRNFPNLLISCVWPTINPAALSYENSALQLCGELQRAREYLLKEENLTKPMRIFTMFCSFLIVQGLWGRNVSDLSDSK